MAARSRGHALRCGAGVCVTEAPRGQLPKRDMSETTVFGWHFVGEKLRDGRPVPADGEWLEHSGQIEMCKAGYHGSLRIIDALNYAPANVICYCEFAGEIVHAYDKLVARRGVGRR